MTTTVPKKTLPAEKKDHWFKTTEQQQRHVSDDDDAAANDVRRLIQDTLQWLATNVTIPSRDSTDEPSPSDINDVSFLRTLSERSYERYWRVVERLMSLRCELVEADCKLRTVVMVQRRRGGGGGGGGGTIRNDTVMTDAPDGNDDDVNDVVSDDGPTVVSSSGWETYDALRNVADDAQARLDRLVDMWERRLEEDEEGTTSSGLVKIDDTDSSRDGDGAKEGETITAVNANNGTTVDSSSLSSSLTPPLPAPPRIIRLAHLLSLTRAELWALHFIVLHNAGQHFPPPSSSSSYSGYWSRGMLRNMAICCPGISSTQLALTFLSPERLHMKQGILTMDDDTYMDADKISCTMGKPVLSAIVGAPLSVEGGLSIDGTVLAQVLAEEEGNACMDVSERTDDGKKEVDEAKIEASSDDNGDIYELLEKLRVEEQQIDEDDNVMDTKEASGENEDKDSSKQKQTKGEEEESSNTPLTPHKDDLDYLNDWFALIAARLEHLQNEMKDDSDFKYETTKKQQVIREKSAKAKTALARATKRTRLTMARYDAAAADSSVFCPRVEQLSRLRQLAEFEKLVIITLIGATLSSDIVRILKQQYKHYGDGAFTVGELLWLHLSELKDQVAHRKYFYKTATLVRERIVTVDEKDIGVTGDLVGCNVEVDRRVLDYCVALDTEIDCLVDGVVLTTPTTTMDQVVLSEGTKQLILETVDNASQMETLKKRLKLNHVFEYGSGTVILLHGPSGVGKTMLSCAIAHHLGQKLLLATSISSAETLLNDLRLVFREARIQNALVFLDECEGLLQSRNLRNGYSVNNVLSEIERYDGLLLLATNRPNDLDEALHRRITLSVELPLPDAVLRKKIWLAHVPPNVCVGPDVNFDRLAMEFELSGGFIKNAMLLALLQSNKCLQRDKLVTKQGDSSNHGHTIVESSGEVEYSLSQHALEKACFMQMQGQFELDYHYESTLPHELSERFDDIICLQINPGARRVFHRVVSEYQSRHLLFHKQQSLSLSPPSTLDARDAANVSLSPCVSVLVLGSCQSGKTTCIRALAAECRRPLVTLSLTDLVRRHRTTTNNQKRETSIFQDIFRSGALVHVEMHLDANEGLETTATTALQALFRVLRTFKGGVLAVELTCSTLQQRQWMNGVASSRGGRMGSGGCPESWFARLVHRVGYVVRVDAPAVGESSCSIDLWKLCVDDGTNGTSSIDTEQLARRFPYMNLGQIQQVVRQARVAAFTNNAELGTEDIVRAATWLEEKYAMAGAESNGLPMYS